MQAIVKGSELDRIQTNISFILSSTKPHIDVITERTRLNEEHLYAAALDYNLAELKPDLRTRFETLFAAEFAKIREMQGRGRVFAAADRVMRAFLRSGEITREIYQATRTFAFGKAQLDSDRTWIATTRSPDAKSGDTPLRALSTALSRYSENLPASDNEIHDYRRRVAERSHALRHKP